MINLRIIIVLLLTIGTWAKAQTKTDVVIYGATPSGIFAAINTARQGHSVALVEEYKHIGGLMSGGLSFTDFISQEALSGTFNEYRFRALAYYEKRYGKNSRQVKECYFGVNAEPHVTELIFGQMLTELPLIKVYTQHRITRAFVIKNKRGESKIQSATFINLFDKKPIAISGKVFIDATYEGDLAVAAGAEYRVGRESRHEFCERFAGHIFSKGGQILTGGTGEGDKKVQAYNFRIIMTDSVENSRKVEMPQNYNREKYLPISQVFKSGKVKQIFTQSAEGILRVQPIANRKADINDIKNAPVRMSSLGKNYEYPDGSTEVRSRIIQEHREHILGMIYFLQNDESIPPDIRREAQIWGLAKDEFTDTDGAAPRNFPYRLYIREARRIMGDVVFTEKDTYQAPNSIRSVLNPNTVAICDYALNCHGVSAPGPVYADMTEGDFNFVPQPFQIPYGVMLPKKFENLLVPVAVSSSHVGFCGIRLEPTWSALGQAAGLAAHLSIKNGVKVTAVKVQELQSLLLKNKAKIIYVSDVDADSPYFEAVQYFGAKGFFHELYPLEQVQIKPRTVHKLQYMDAIDYHNLESEKVLEEILALHWIRKLPDGQQADAKKLYQSKLWKRGEFLNNLYLKK
ncbi:FAD-dependent oxidoreductase [Runella sp. CRIBMP]|uniref:FAD-dependent oxidoreductase n=1 Tax=Runella sp. CRIBMP TaxID=2683261 RepID=UPI0014132486|nr:FAD-dependent oxidoreductase [Runella sp. CRIBMP]NBB21881.1 FAD-dependent oxidoreductase [Runella sp. CRIBMP]